MEIVRGNGPFPLQMTDDTNMAKRPCDNPENICNITTVVVNFTLDRIIGPASVACATGIGHAAVMTCSYIPLYLSTVLCRSVCPRHVVHQP
jgi:hypothetical protein